MRRSALLTGLAVALSGCSHKPPTDPEMLADWTKNLYGAVRAERLSPAVASRLYAYTMIGMYAGLAAAEPDLPPLENRLNGIPALPRARRDERYDPALTMIATERTLVDTLFRDGL